MLDLGDGDVELLQPILDPPQHHPLVLERLRVGQVHLDVQDRNSHGGAGRVLFSGPAVQAVTATRSIEKTSITSPTLTSL